MRSLLALGFVTSLVLADLHGAEHPDAPPEGFVALFNGKDLEGWTVTKGANKDAWKAEDGMIVCSGDKGGWLLTDKEFTDFELRLDFKIPPRGNSGVALRTPAEGNPAYVGMEIQILDDAWHLDPNNVKDLKPTQKTGAIYDVVPPSKDALKPVGEWNTFVITCKGRRVAVVLNGEQIVDADLDDYKDKFDKHPGLKAEKGRVGLQSHGSRVEFRRLFLKPL
jgi:hypothetical protein